MRAWVLHSDTVWDFNSPIIAGDIIRKFVECGFESVSHTEFFGEPRKTVGQVATVQPDDVLVIHINVKEPERREVLKNLPCRKILWSVDETKSDGILWRSEKELCTAIGCTTMMIPFHSERNVRCLNEAGIDVLALPHSTKYDRHPTFPTKDHDILVSGNLTEYYPTRRRVYQVLAKNLGRYKVAFLDFPGYSISQNPGQLCMGDYVDAISRCWLMLSCKAGWRDRMIAKKLEAAAGWCLPISDVPSYMHPDAAREMVHVEAAMTDEEILSLIDSALASKRELVARIERYRTVFVQHHDIDHVVPAVASRIRSGQVDWSTSRKPL